MRRIGCAVLGCLALVGCGPEAERTSLGLAQPLREALLNLPLACTASGPHVEKVMRTEDEGVTVCHGFVRWDAIDGLRLDVDRYGTILELEIDPKPLAVGDVYEEQERANAGRQNPYWLRAKLFRLRGRVTATLKGAAPLGEAEFPIVTLANWNLGLNFGALHSAQGGWPFLRYRVAVRGLVFLPTSGIVDNILVGCAEGHVVWLDDGEHAESYVRDVRRITTLDRTELANASPSLFATFHEEGGAMLGFFVAEHAPPHATLPILEASTGESPFHQGLYRGIRRMQELLAIGSYPAPAWRDVSTADVAARVARWAGAHEVAPWSARDSGNQVCNASGVPSASHELMANARQSDLR